MRLAESIIISITKRKLKKALNMGSDPRLLHAFPVLNPALPESERVIDEIVDWFEKHAPQS
ncbi:MAG: hypothetical protein IKV20_00425 [Clostridia bacterium]|nr:hypothetical protein [Clostridia bacterium]